MADNNPPVEEQGGAKGPRAMYKILAWFLAPVFVITALPTVILLTVGMVPTIVAYIVDRNPMKYASRTVGYLNFCGCLPYALGLWTGDHSVDAVIAILVDPFAWFAMYGAAAVGWLIYYTTPPVVAAWMAVNHKIRQQALKARQTELMNEWGNAVRRSATEAAEAQSPSTGLVPSQTQVEPDPSEPDLDDEFAEEEEEEGDDDQ